MTVNTYAEAPVWDDFPDVKLLLGDVNPIDIELAQYVWSTTTEVFTHSTTTAGFTIAASGTGAGTDPGTGVQIGGAHPEIPGSLSTDPSHTTDVTLVATNPEGSVEELFRVKYAGFEVVSPRQGVDSHEFASTAAPTQFTYRHILNSTDTTVGGVQNRNFAIGSMGGTVNANQLNWTALINRVAIQQLTSGGASVDRSVNSAERRSSIFPLAPRSNPVMASSTTGVGVYVGNDGHYELTPHAAFTAPVLIGIRGDDAAGGPPDLGYDGTFIFAAPALTGQFNFPGFAINGPISLSRDLSWEGITAPTPLVLNDLSGAVTKWLLSRADGPALHPTMSGTYGATVVALSTLGNAANAANQFPGAASGNVLRITSPADSGLTPGAKPHGQKLAELRMFFFSMKDLSKGGTYSYSANVATNVAAARASADTPHVVLMMGTSPHLFEYSYNELAAQSIPRDGKWINFKTTCNFSNAMFTHTDQETGLTANIEYGGILLYLSVLSPHGESRTTAYTGSEVYVDNLRVYPSEFDLDLALGSTEVPWTVPSPAGLSILGNAGGFQGPMVSSFGDVEAVAGSGATLLNNFPVQYVVAGGAQVGPPAANNPGIDFAVAFGSNNFVTPNITGSNGHSVSLDPLSRGSNFEAGGSLFLFFDPHSYRPTQLFKGATYATRAFLHTNETNPNTVGQVTLVMLGAQRTDYVGGLYPFYASNISNVGIPNQAGVWRQLTIEHPWVDGSAQNIPVSGVAGTFGHYIDFLLFSQSIIPNNGTVAGETLNDELKRLGQAGGQNIFGTNGDKSPGAGVDVGKVFVDDISHHRIDDALALYDDSLFE